jgi:hypothetical protein
MPYFANTYLVNPEQSNPPRLVPPREYLIPRHANAVWTSLDVTVEESSADDAVALSELDPVLWARRVLYTNPQTPSAIATLAQFPQQYSNLRVVPSGIFLILRLLGFGFSLNITADELVCTNRFAECRT